MFNVDITEILLKVALTTITLTFNPYWSLSPCSAIFLSKIVTTKLNGEGKHIQIERTKN